MTPYDGKVILITGATDGLGKKVALDLTAGGATVLLHGRSQQKGEATLQEIRQATGSQKLSYYNADFSSLDAVRRLSDQVLADQKRLDILINNAGLGAGSRQSGREMSADGFELRFAINYLAPFLLTHRLLPLLRQSAPARIVNVSSAGQQHIDFDNVMLEHDYDGLRAYRQSKLAQILFTFDLAERLKDSGVTVNCLHPSSLMNTKMVFDTDYFGAPMTTIEEGAHAVEYVATSPEVEGMSGEYFDREKRAHADPQAYDPQARAQLWALSKKLVKLTEAN
ncbi:MAG TPA: SDR family oxidoreductase [Longilinea sp.]|nr:SDR family oxidoreductase [Longilinea sp.]